MSGQQVGNEVTDDRTGAAGAARDDARGEDMGLGIPDDVDGTALLARAVQLEPPGMATRRLHLVEAKSEPFEARIVSDGLAQAPAMCANRRDDDLHDANISRTGAQWKLTSSHRAWWMGYGYTASRKRL